MAIIVLDSIVPSDRAVVPMATAPAVCQHTFLARAPPVIVTLVAEAWVRDPATWKIHTSFGPPSRVTSFDIETSPVHLYRPGGRISPNTVQLELQQCSLK